MLVVTATHTSTTTTAKTVLTAPKQQTPNVSIVGTAATVQSALYARHAT